MMKDRFLHRTKRFRAKIVLISCRQTTGFRNDGQENTTKRLQDM